MADGHIPAAAIDPHFYTNSYHAAGDNPNAHTRRDTYTHCNADLNAVVHGISYAHVDVIIHADYSAVVYAYSIAHANGDARPNAYGYRDLNSDVNAHAHRHAAALQRQLSSR